MSRAWMFSILLVGSTAHAFVPGDDDGLVVAIGAQPRTRAVDADRVAGWHATRDRDTGAVTQLWGSYVEVPGAMRDAAIAERAARTFLAQHALPPGTRIEDFVVAANRIDDNKRTVAFVQTWKGLAVVGGQMHVVFANDRLFAAGSDALPDVTATVSRARATPTRAAAWAQTTLRATGERVVLPIVRGKGDIEYKVADVFDAPAKHWTVYVAPDGTPLARQSRVHHATSTLQFDVGQRYATDTRTAKPAAELGITVDGTAMTTGTDGSFSWSGTAASTVVTSVSGPRISIVNEAGPAATTTLTAQPGVPITWGAATNEFVDAQLSAYVYVSAAKAIGRRIDPALAWLDQPIEVHVNVNATCNAFSTGDSIHFYRANAQCQNTALVADVVHHEFGHSFHFQEVIPGAGGDDESILEGVADFFASDVTGDSGIGRGLAYDDNAVRELDPIGSERVYPRDVTAISHFTGLIIGGALWDLRKQMIAKLGEAPGIAATEKIFVGILRRASDLTMTYNAALVADDDDGNLGNGTPHGCIIESAFGRHGLAGPGFRETRILPPIYGVVLDTDVRVIQVLVDTPTGTACPPATVTAMTFRWRVGTDPFTDVAMVNEGGSWIAVLPKLPDGTVMEHQIVATLDTGETLLLPDNNADPLYQLFYGDPTEIWCERFDADPRWKQTGDVEWDVGTSKPMNSASGDPDAAYAGTLWLGTDLKSNGRYHADILTSIETPDIDASAYGSVHLQFRRWLVIEDSALDVATIRVNGKQIWANATNETDSLDHVDREWRFVDFDVTQFAASPMTIAWTLASDPFRELGGWNLDEICVVGFDRKQVCGDGIVDPGEECDGDQHCEPITCVRRNDDGGCCSSSKDSFVSSLCLLLVLGLLQFLMMFVRRR